MTSTRPAPVQGPNEPEEFPGDVHWYDLPDDDAEPDDEAWSGESAGPPARWA
ncbi:hypothetical protein GCM10010149_51740 [Nonomuraea roseoviolacea subsp. roseoviolacea]|uniref:hypothetical protein n=1 Tax=Nonomuraea roseoviolacea TaxID=103837 RepID=UPI0031DBF939